MGNHSPTDGTEATVQTAAAAALQARMMIVILTCLLLLAGPGTPLEVLVAAPDGEDGISNVVEAEARKADETLRNQWGLFLPKEVRVEILASSRFRQMEPGDEAIRYDGFAAAGEGYVAVDAMVLRHSSLRLPEVLWHEFFHVAAGPLKLPRWFDEGMAMLFTGSHFPVMGSPEPPKRRMIPPVSTLDREFASDDGTVVRDAYAESCLFVGYLADRLGKQKLKDILASRKADSDRDFYRQFQDATGYDADALFTEYRKSHASMLRSIWRGLRLVPLFAWLAVLLVVGGLLKWKRLRALLAREEERDAF